MPGRCVDYLVWGYWWVSEVAARWAQAPIARPPIRSVVWALPYSQVETAKFSLLLQPGSCSLLGPELRLQSRYRARHRDCRALFAINVTLAHKPNEATCPSSFIYFVSRGQSCAGVSSSLAAFVFFSKFRPYQMN